MFVVLSAMSGTTNSLVEISDYLYKKNPDGANEVINRLEEKYMKHVEELYPPTRRKAYPRLPEGGIQLPALVHEGNLHFL